MAPVTLINGGTSESAALLARVDSLTDAEVASEFRRIVSGGKVAQIAAGTAAPAPTPIDADVVDAVTAEPESNAERVLQ
jgi:hypothetical protein